MVLKLSLYPLPFISLPNAFSSSLDSRMSNMESTMACFCSIVHVRNVVVTKKNTSTVSLEVQGICVAGTGDEQ